MSRRSHAVADELSAEVVMPVGQVAAVLGVSAVTIRSWERRYGIGPSLRSRGRHRRYSAVDIDRLRRMMALVDEGVSPVDAARLSAKPAPSASGDVDNLLRAVEGYDTVEVASILDGQLDQIGTAGVWTGLVAPAFRSLERRFAEDGDCTDIEVMLAGAATDAVERYLVRHRLQHHGQPVLLVPCPEERHILPITVLRAVLLERSQPVIALGAGGNDVAVLTAAERVQPSVVVLWSTIRRAGQADLKRRLERRGHPTAPAGPGWPRPVRLLSDLDQAVDHLTAGSTAGSRRRPKQRA